MIYDIEKLSRATFVTHDRKRLQIVAQSIRCFSPIAQIRIKHIMNKIMEVGDGN